MVSVQQRHHKVIHQLFEDNSLGKVASIETIPDFGEVNIIYHVKASSDQFVVRLNDDEDASQFQKEAWCIEKARDVGLPTPKVTCYGGVDKTNFMILPYLEGQNGSVFPNKSLLWETLGKFTNRIHEIKTNGFGDKKVKNETNLFEDTWKRYLDYNIESLNSEDLLIELGVLTDLSSNKLKETFKELDNESFSFGLNHGDISEKNTIINPSGEIWLLDWGSANAHVIPHHDFLGVLGWIDRDSVEFSAFLKGYGMTKNKFDQTHPNLRKLELLQITDKLRWAIDRKPERIEKYKKKLLLIL